MSVTHNFDKVLSGFLERARDFRQPIQDWYGYMLRQTQLTFKKLGKRGNNTPFRGVRWEWFADQYTRKTDGVTVPAHGGKPRLRKGRSHRKKSGGYRKGVSQEIGSRKFLGVGKTGGKLVWGRLRSSKKRITASSRVLDDRGILKQAAMSQRKIDKYRAVFSTPTDHADFIQKKRPFVFVTYADAEILQGMIEKWLVGGTSP